ncbi:MAG TPA: hypothetical protein VFU05_05935 [Cyclobacteriaceae bacterium]|nr:hypothetical protein [Cyclobacteriaceae bacterium]
MQTNISALEELKQLLQSSHKTPVRKVFVGFDGFVDKIKKAVKEKHNYQTLYFSSIREFADRLLMASGRSGQVQMDIQQVKLGGNAPILSNTLGKLVVPCYCVGSMGYPQKHEVFSGMNPLCEPISVLNPGLSDAIEFGDGKLIFSELEVFDHYNWLHIKQVAGVEKIANAVSECSLIAFVDWANLPYASDIWKGMLEDVIKPSERRDFLFLFDLCDPSKKTLQQIDEVLDMISSFSPYGKVTLGLNENETLKLWAALSGHDFIKDKVNIPPVLEAGDFLYRSLNIDSLLVHPIDRSIVYRQRDTIELQGRLVTKPKVLTGGGDNLNAGYCLGLILGFTLQQCMLLGMAASGAYIENGASPNRQDIIEYLQIWMRDLEKKQS